MEAAMEQVRKGTMSLTKAAIVGWLSEMMGTNWTKAPNFYKFLIRSTCRT